MAAIEQQLNVRKLEKIFAEIRATPPGKEPSMYPSIRNIFTGILGHQAKDVLTDSRTDAGVRPDVAIAGRQEIGNPVANWIVVEAKDESVFETDEDANRIIRSKWRYVTAGTEWFLCIDPSVIRVRRVSKIEIPAQEQPDQIFPLTAPIEAALLHLLQQMHAEKFKSRRQLEDFREGKADTFGRIKIKNDDSRRMFMEALKASANQLSVGVKNALGSIEAERTSVRAVWKSFKVKYPNVEIRTAPYKAVGVGSVPSAERVAFREHLNILRSYWGASPVAFTIETQLWGKYEARSQNAQEANELLIEETSALLLSRILMLRFFEDYEYFGRRRYLCNGGVAAFQTMRAYLGEKYPAWLKQAYEAGGKIYQSVFDISALDWVLESKNEVFSASLEQAMLFLSVLTSRRSRKNF